MPDKTETKLNKILNWFQNHTISSIIIVIFIIVVGVGEFFDSFTKIKSFFFPASSPALTATPTPSLTEVQLTVIAESTLNNLY